MLEVQPECQRWPLLSHALNKQLAGLVMLRVIEWLKMERQCIESWCRVGVSIISPWLMINVCIQVG